MAKDVNIKVKAETSSFTSSMKQMRSDLKAVENDYKLLDKELQINGSKVEQLSAKYKSLESQLNIQSNMTSSYNQKVSKLETSLEKKRRTLEKANKAYEEGKKKLDANSDELQKLKNKQEAAAKAVDNAEQSYQKYQRELDNSIKKEGKLQAELKQTGDALNKQNTYISRVNDEYKKMQDKTAAVRNGLSSAGRTLTTGVTLPLIAAGAAAINYASDLEESTNKVEVAFGKSADSVKEFAKTTRDSYGIAEGTALDMAALFGDMGTGMGMPQEKAAEMSKSLVGLAGDLASFKNIGLDQAETALKGIFTGETESLKGLGVVMTEANLEAYALANGIGKSVDKMTQAEKVNLRYQYVLSMTRNAHGDYANTADGTANSLRTFTESTKELAASFGQELLPVITPIIQKGTELVQKFGELDDEEKQQIIRIAAIAAAAGPVLTIASKGITVINGVSAAIKGIGGVAGNIGKVATEGQKAASGVGSILSVATKIPGTAKIAALAIGGITVAAIGLAKYISEADERAAKAFKKSAAEAKDAADAYTEALDKEEQAKSLSDEWKDLNKTIKDGKGSAEELKAAEERRKEIEEWFISNYGDYITAEEKKNGIRQESIDKVNEETEALTENEKQKLQTKVLENALNAIDYQKKLPVLKAENKEREKTLARLEDEKIALLSLQNEYKKEYATAITDEQKSAVLTKYSEKLREITGLDYDNIAYLENRIRGVNNEIKNTTKEIEKTEGEINNATEGINDFESAMRTLANDNLNGKYDEMSQSFYDMQGALWEISTTGEITKGTLNKLIDDIPELAYAKDKPAVLKKAIAEISEVLEAAGVDIDYLLTKFNNIKSEYGTKIVVSTEYRNNNLPTVSVGNSAILSPFSIRGNAKGTKNAHQGPSVVNEKGTELIEREDGKFEMYSGSPAMTYLNSGDKVYTAEETKKIMSRRKVNVPGFAEGKSAFEIAKDDFSYRQSTSEVSLAEELAWWQEILKRFPDDAEAVKEANKQIYKLTKDLKSDEADDYKDMVSDFISDDERWNERQLAFGKISETEFLQNIGNRADKYREFAEEVLHLDYLTEEERETLHKEYIEAAEDLDLEYFENWKGMAEDALDTARELSEDYLENKNFFGDWGSDDPLSAYNRIKEREYKAVANGLQTQEEADAFLDSVGKSMYDQRIQASDKWLERQEKYNDISVEDYIAGLDREKAYTEEYYSNGLITYRQYVEAIEDIDDKKFEKIKDRLDDETEAYYEAQQKMLDAKREAIEAEYAAEEKAETQAEREEKLRELRRQERLYEGAVTTEGKQKLQDIRDEIADIEKQQLDEAREEEKEQRLAAIDAEEDMLEAEKENALNSVSKFTASMLGIIDSGYSAISGYVSNFNSLFDSLLKMIEGSGSSSTNNNTTNYNLVQNIQNNINDTVDAQIYGNSAARAFRATSYRR